jgi:hypothetical protein
MLIPRGFRRSSRRISPGCTGGSRRAFLGIVPPSVVVHNLYVLRFAVLPHKADPILVIDPDAVLPPPITAKGLEVIARKHAQVVESLGRVQLRQLTLSDPSNVPEPTCRVPLEQCLCISVPEGPDHLLSILRMA